VIALVQRNPLDEGWPFVYKSKGHFTHETESRDRCTLSTLIGGKGGAGPSLLHSMLEGPTE
jgi:hypothetical protein